MPSLFPVKPPPEIAFFPNKDASAKSMGYLADGVGEPPNRLVLPKLQRNISKIETDESSQTFFLEDFLCPSSPHEPANRFKTRNWEFYFSLASTISDQKLEDKFRLPIPGSSATFELYIKNRDNGVTFRFSPADAIAKLILEKFPSKELVCDEHVFFISNCSYSCTLPTYLSPLQPGDGLDSAFTGRLMFMKSMVKPWEDVHWETLGKQMLWTDKHKIISGVPRTCFFPKKKEVGPLANVVGDLYSGVLWYDDGGVSDCDSSCSYNLVVTDSGWFFRLFQLFFNSHGARRTREMTMHCCFDEDIVYREIIEQQSRVFEIGFPECCKKEGPKQADPQMCVRFHEVKRLNVQGGSDSVAVDDATKYHPHAVLQPDETSFGELELSDERVKMLLADCGKLIKCIEAESHTHIAIIPIFRHPYLQSSKQSQLELLFEGVLKGGTQGATRRSVYIFGSKDNIEYAKSLFDDLWADHNWLDEIDELIGAFDFSPATVSEEFVKE